MAKNAKKQVLQFGLESSYGTDPTLDATTGQLVSNINFNPLAGSIADRQKAHATFGADTDQHVSINQVLSFDVGMAGSGAAGTAPAYGAVLRALGLSETVTASTKVEYAPIDASQESAAAYFNWADLRHKALGLRGTGSFKWQGGALPMISAALTGLPAVITDTAAVNVETALSAFIKESEVNQVNTATCTLHGVAIVLEQLQIDIGNVVDFRDRPNSAKTELTDRKVVGSISFEAPTIAGLDIVARAKANTLGALQVVHGITAGNIVQLDAPKVQLRQPTYTRAGNVLLIQAQLQLTRDAAGNDEFKFTVK